MASCVQSPDRSLGFQGFKWENIHHRDSQAMCRQLGLGSQWPSGPEIGATSSNKRKTIRKLGETVGNLE